MLWVFNFNSIKVRLEQANLALRDFVLRLFQFHKGTIRTIDAELLHPLLGIFQFHKGTIRTQSGTKHN